LAESRKEKTTAGQLSAANVEASKTTVAKTAYNIRDIAEESEKLTKYSLWLVAAQHTGRDRNLLTMRFFIGVERTRVMNRGVEIEK
jgi:hypothetical protein